MLRPLVASILLVGCAVAPVTATDPPPTSPVPPATTQAPPTTELQPGAESPCPPPGFAPSRLPDRVATEPPAPAAIEVDRWTALPGTSLVLWSDETGSPVVALVRGALPPEQWSGKPLEITVHGTRAALGPLSEGMWAAAWFEGPDRCDDYTLYVFPPTSEAEAVAVAKSIAP